MKYKYKFIKYYKNLPFNIFIYQEDDKFSNWHQDIELIFLLQGEATLNVKDKEYNLLPNDIVLINRNEIHKMTNFVPGTIILSLVLNPYFYDMYYDNFSSIYFKCNTSFGNIEEEKYSYIRSKISSIVINLLSQGQAYQFKLLSESLQLTEHLIKNFKLDVLSESIISDDYLHSRFSRILEYINKNYNQKITLTELSKREYISVYYLSRLFTKHMGIGFNKYINLLRLDKSMYDLVNTNKSILEVAIDNGFSSAKSYRTVFKNHYNTTPSEYRKQLLATSQSTAEMRKSLPIDSATMLEILKRYQDNNLIGSKVEPRVIPIKIDCTKPKTSKFSLEKILYFDFVYDGLSLNWQKNLEKIHDEIDFDYIRFAGILNQGMYFYNDQNQAYNWFNADSLLDFFIQKNLKPFIKLTYNEKNHSIRSWHILLENFIQHCIERYGLANVSKWKFEFAHQDKKYCKMIELYTQSLYYFTSKFDKLKFGIEFAPSSNYYEEYFLDNFKSKNLNFITVTMTEEIYRETKSFVNVLLNKIQSEMGLKTYFIKVASNNYFNDTCHRANQLVCDILGEHHGFDTQVHFMDNLQTTNLFHGGQGLLTYNGLKKPIYNAYYLISKLKGDLVSHGPFHYAVENDNKIVILLYNNADDIDGQLKGIDHYERSRILGNRSIFIELDLLLNKGKYKLKSYTLNRENGSIFDEWIHMGKPEYFDNEELDFIKSKEILLLRSAIQELDSKFILRNTLPMDGIKLIEISKI